MAQKPDFKQNHLDISRILHGQHHVWLPLYEGEAHLQRSNGLLLVCSTHIYIIPASGMYQKYPVKNRILNCQTTKKKSMMQGCWQTGLSQLYDLVNSSTIPEGPEVKALELESHNATQPGCFNKSELRSRRHFAGASSPLVN